MQTTALDDEQRRVVADHMPLVYWAVQKTARRYVEALGGDAVYDIAVDVLISTVRRGVPDPDAVRKYFCWQVFRRVVKAYRSRPVNVGVTGVVEDFDAVADVADSPADPRLRSAIATLPGDDADVLVSHAVRGESVTDIAKRRGRSRCWVQGTLVRATEKLRNAYLQTKTA